VLPPFAITSSAAPSTLGSPTIVFGLSRSLAVQTTFRFVAAPGFATLRVFPRIVWSAPPAGEPIQRPTSTAQSET